MPRPLARLPGTMALFLVMATAPLAAPEARAGEVQLAVGLSGQGTSWSGRGDGSGSGTLRLGYRFLDLAGIYLLGRLGYGAVDDRLLVSLSAGAQVWGRLGALRPYARLGLLHNHEEPWPAVRHQPAGALLGVGDGIRHRTGLEVGAGFDIPLWKRSRWELLLGLEGNASWLTYSFGPSWYWGGGASFGFHYAL